MDRITKRELRQALCMDTDAEVADFFQISASAVSQWGMDQAIPELRQLQAERIRPDLPDLVSRQRESEGDPPVHRRVAEEGESPAESANDSASLRAA